MVKSKNCRYSSPLKAGSPKKQNQSGTGQDATEADSENEGETEVRMLQRACRQLDGARRMQEREAQETIRRQRRLIGCLSEERNKLLLSLRRTGGTEDHVAQSFHTLLQRSSDIDDLIAREKDKLLTLDREILCVQRKTDKERKISPPKEDSTRRIQRLTNQIAQANSGFGSLVSTNSALRQDIQTMRGEKDKFMLIRNRLHKELQAVQKEMRNILDEANECIHMREEAQARTLRAHDQRGKDSEHHDEEVREIERELSHARKVEQFLQEKTKTRERDRNFLNAKEKREARAREHRVERKVLLNRYEEAMEKISEIVDRTPRRLAPGGPRRSRAVDRDNRTSAAGEGTGEDEQRRSLWEIVSRRSSTLVLPMFREAVAGDGDTERRGRRLTEHRRRSTLLLGASLEEQERLKELARKTLEQQTLLLLERNSPDIDAELFYSVYMEREDVNFALFNYVCEQTSEMEDLSKDIQQLKHNIELQGEMDAKVNGEHSDRVRALEEARREVTEASRKLQADVGKQQKILRLIKTGIEDLAVQLGIGTAQQEISKEWTDDTVTRATLSLLGLMEQRLTDMLAAHFYLMSQDTGEAAVKIRQMPPMQEVPPAFPDFKIPLPSTSLFLDSEEECDEEELKPLSIEELQQRAAKSIQSTVSGPDLLSNVISRGRET